MFCLNIALGNVAWRLLFKTEETAIIASVTLSDACKNAPNDLFSLNDDFGQTIRVRPFAIHGVMSEDMEKTKLAAAEMMLQQARAQILANNLAQSDPAIKTASMSRSPSIISPMPNGGRPF